MSSSTSASALAPLTSKKQQRYNIICNIVFDSIETLNAHNRIERSEARHLPVGVS